MTTSELLRIGPDRLQLDRWNDERRTVVVRSAIPDGPPSVDTLRRALELLHRRGIVQVTTPALDDAAQAPYLAAGFVVRDQLHLLRHDLHHLTRPSNVQTRRGRGAHDLRRAATIDRLAFPPDWWLDPSGLQGARRATPVARFRFVEQRAYAISGAAGNRGYLQRVAVAPDERRRGSGTALVLDGLRWMRRRGATHAVVNTQQENHAALALYLNVGFVPMPAGLAVLAHGFEAPAAHT